MSNNDLKLTPHLIDAHRWWYEDEAGIVVLADKVDSERVAGATRTLIRWNSLRAALKRKDKKAKK